jgi:hypothetical protein
MVADISRSGIGLESPRELPPGSRVMVILRNSGVFAVVRHCRVQEGEGYRAGIAIDAVVALDASRGLVSDADLNMYVRCMGLSRAQEAIFMAHHRQCGTCREVSAEQPKAMAAGC